MTDSLDQVAQVFPVGPGHKVIILMHQDASIEFAEALADRLTEWWLSDEPTLVLAGGAFQLVRADEAEQMGKDEPETES